VEKYKMIDKMIDPNKIEEIEQLNKDEIAFPLINYHLQLPLHLPATTLLAAYTTISSNVDQELLVGLIWNNNGDIDWQNRMLQHLSQSIYEMINQYHINPTDQLLTKIFIWIQLWGGNSGRSVFVRGNRWPQNFNINSYRDAVQKIKYSDFENALSTLNGIYGISTAFATKHIHFWSNAIAPIYDSIIAAIIFGRNQNQVRPHEYKLYIDSLDHLINEIKNNQVTRSSIERSLFNWANTPLGIQWRNIRLGIK
jgi:hypothetical protein